MLEKCVCVFVDVVLFEPSRALVRLNDNSI